MKEVSFWRLRVLGETFGGCLVSRGGDEAETEKTKWWFRFYFLVSSSL